jgi:hypothetical protein
MDRRGLAFQRPLIAVQVAISLVLVVSSLLFVRSFQNLFTLDAGFRQQGTSFHVLDLSGGPSDAERGRPLVQEALASIRSAPGIEAAATSSHLQLSGSAFWLAVRTSEGAEGSSFFTWVIPGQSPSAGKRRRESTRRGRTARGGLVGLAVGRDHWEPVPPQPVRLSLALIASVSRSLGHSRKRTPLGYGELVNEKAAERS